MMYAEKTLIILLGTALERMLKDGPGFACWFQQIRGIGTRIEIILIKIVS